MSTNHTYNEVETLLAEARALLAEARAVLVSHGRFPLADIPEDMPNVSTPPAPHHPDLARLSEGLTQKRGGQYPIDRLPFSQKTKNKTNMKPNITVPLIANITPAIPQESATLITCAQAWNLLASHTNKGGELEVIERGEMVEDPYLCPSSGSGNGDWGMFLGDLCLSERWDDFYLLPDGRLRTHTPRGCPDPQAVIRLLPLALADIPEDMPNVSTPPAPHHPDLPLLTVSSI